MGRKEVKCVAQKSGSLEIVFSSLLSPFLQETLP